MAINAKFLYDEVIKDIEDRIDGYNKTIDELEPITQSYRSAVAARIEMRMLKRSIEDLWEAMLETEEEKGR